MRIANARVALLLPGGQEAAKKSFVYTHGNTVVTLLAVQNGFSLDRAETQDQDVQHTNCQLEPVRATINLSCQVKQLSESAEFENTVSWNLASRFLHLTHAQK